jgi:hypothetical protein
MPLRFRHVVVDTWNLPMLARFRTQAPGWQVLSEWENEIGIGLEENARSACASYRSLK